MLMYSWEGKRTVVCDGMCMWVSMCECLCVQGGGGKNTCVTGNLSLFKECDSDPGMKVSVFVRVSVLLCTEAGAQLLFTIMTDSKSHLLRGSSLMLC